MKIVMVGGYPLEGKRSGSVTYVEKLSQYIARVDDMEVHMITVGRRNECIKMGGVIVHVFTMRRFIMSFAFPFASWSLSSQVKRLAPDVLHASGSFPYTTVATLLRRRYPVVMSVFSLSREELRWEKSHMRILRKVLISIPNDRYVIPRIQHIIVQSEHMAELTRQWTDSSIHVVPEGIDYEHLQHFRLPVTLTEPPDLFIAVHFRKLKGLDILIKALATVARHVPDVKLYIGGSGEEEDKLRKLVGQLGLENNVKFLGFISDEEKVHGYYQAAKIVVVPSRWDTEPFAALEGASLGKPVIASRACNASVVVDGETGFLFDSEDVDGLADRIVTLLADDTLRREMGQAARTKAKEYDWPRIAKRTVSVYEAAIADFRGRKGRMPIERYKK